LITSLGWQISWAKETKWGVIRPQTRIGYGRENFNQEEALLSTLVYSPFAIVQGATAARTGGFSTGFIREDPGEGWMNLGLGAQFDLKNHLSFIVDYEGQFFRQDLEIHTGTVKLQYSF
jgi:outer membrane autotransporter protein